MMAEDRMATGHHDAALTLENADGQELIA